MTLVGFTHADHLHTLVFDVHGHCYSWTLAELAIACKSQNRTPTQKEFRSLPSSVLSIALVNEHGRAVWQMDKDGERAIAQCLDCHYYHGKDGLVCVLHPLGVDGDCVDFRERLSEWNQKQLAEEKQDV